MSHICLCLCVFRCEYIQVPKLSQIQNMHKYFIPNPNALIRMHTSSDMSFCKSHVCKHTHTHTHTHEICTNQQTFTHTWRSPCILLNYFPCKQYKCKHAYTHTHTRACMHICIHTHTPTNTHRCMHAQLTWRSLSIVCDTSHFFWKWYTCTHTHTHTHPCIHIYIHTKLGTHIHICPHNWCSLGVSCDMFISK